MKQPPCVHVAEQRSAQHGAAREPLVPQVCQLRAELRVDPVVVDLGDRDRSSCEPAEFDSPSRKHTHHQASPALVVVHQIVHRAGHVTDRRPPAFPAHDLGRATDGGFDQPVLGAEVAQQCLLGDAGFPGQRIERELLQAVVVELLVGRVEQRVPGALLRPGSRATFLYRGTIRLFFFFFFFGVPS